MATKYSCRLFQGPVADWHNTTEVAEVPELIESYLNSTSVESIEGIGFGVQGGTAYAFILIKEDVD